MTFDDLKLAIQADNYYVTGHAFEEAVEDRFTITEVITAVLRGEIIEDYADRKPFPRCLVLGRTSNGIPVHTVWEDDVGSGAVVLVTVYRPTADDWIEWKHRR